MKNRCPSTAEREATTVADTVVVLNSRAGTIRDRQPDEVESIVRGRLADHGAPIEVVLAEGDRFLRAIDKAVAAAPERLIVGGGDGSVGYAARQLAGRGTSLGVLPLGTMNLFARSLRLPTELEPALEALAHAASARIDLASVNGRIFHTLAGLGYFAEVARARSQVRDDVDLPFGRYIAAARASFRAFTRPGHLDLGVDTPEGHRDVSAYAVFISNNRLSANGFDRERLDEGVIEAHFAEGEGLSPRFEAALDILAGRWRENPAIDTVGSSRLVVHSRRPRLWLSIDGELARLDTPLVFEALPGALSVLRPEAPSAISA